MSADRAKVLSEIGRLTAALSDASIRLRGRVDAAKEVSDLCMSLAQSADHSTIVQVLELLTPHLTQPDDVFGGYVTAALLSFGAPVIPVLSAAARTADQELRRRLVALVGRTFIQLNSIPVDSLPTVRAWFEDADDQVRAIACGMLAESPEPTSVVVEQIGRGLEDGSIEVRAAAAEALARCAWSRKADITAYTQGILSLTGDRRSSSRFAVISCLRYLSVPMDERVRIVSTYLQDDAPEVVRNTSELVAKSADAAEFASVLPLLVLQLHRREYAFIPSCEAIAAIGSAARTHLNELSSIAENSDPFRAVHVARCIWKVSDTATIAIPHLQRALLSGHPGAEEAACDVLSRMGSDAAPAVTGLIAALASTDSYDLNWAAVDALGAIAHSEPRVVETLIQHFSHNSPIVRGAAGRALGGLGDEAVPRLEQAIREIPLWRPLRRQAVRQIIHRIRENQRAAAQLWDAEDEQLPNQ